jgi:predicted acetyltransferase
MENTYQMKLRPLTLSDQESALQAHHELMLENWEFLLNSFKEQEPWGDFLERVENQRMGKNLEPGRVLATFLVAEVNGEIVGRVSIRHSLNEYLAKFGGHIGYGIRPASRRNGYATEILRQSLLLANSLGVESALLTCDDDNLGSSRTIEKCNGILESKVRDSEGTLKRRYWVPTSVSG